jgi:hypothetical protein
VRRDADVARVRTLVAASGGRVGIVTLPTDGAPRFVLDLDYVTAASGRYPAERQARSRIAIELAPRHPFQPPLTRVLTPVFHPNVFVGGVVCLGSQWLASEGMDLFVQRVVRLLAFDPLLVNTRSAANGAALQWYLAALRQHPAAFPSDAAALALGAPPAASSAAPTAAPTAAPSATPSATPSAAPAAGAADGGRVVRDCPHCAARLRLPAGRSGSVRCPVCGGEFETRT